jgi:hypothetical protein
MASSLWTTMDFTCPCGWGYKKILPRGTRKLPLIITLHKKTCALNIKTTDVEIKQNIEWKPSFKGENRMTSHKKKIPSNYTLVK